jgi:glutaredoxin/glutathione-dependent peroxiredoxin
MAADRLGNLGQVPMTISIGDRLPDAVFMEPGDDGPVDVSSTGLFPGHRVVLFALPGAFTRTCSAAHLPSFMRTAAAFRARGIDEVICLAVNDPFVMKAWDAATGASEAGIRMLTDPAAAFTRALGMLNDIPSSGLFGRSRRYSMLVEDGVVTRLNIETTRGCDISAGEVLLESLDG